MSREQRHEVASWITANEKSVPEPVRIFLLAHQEYLKADGDLRRRFNETWRELGRALGIIASSERRRSGNPLAQVSRGRIESAQNQQQKLEAQRDRSVRLGDWHTGLTNQHTRNAKRLEDKLEEMKNKPTIPRQEGPSALELQLAEEIAAEPIEPTAEEKARAEARGWEFLEHLEQGDGADGEFASVSETLMPDGAVLGVEHIEALAAQASEQQAEATVIKTLKDKRIRYDIAVLVNRIELEVEKQVVVDGNGQRTVIAASTDEYGPPRYSVTWSALATLAVLVGQFAMPLNRLATLFSAVGKRFTAGGLSRLLHYVAVRLVAIYIELSEQLSDAEILGGDDTPCRVLEVNTHFERLKSTTADKNKPPWAQYRTKSEAEQSIERCEQLQQEMVKRRADGEREAKRTADEQPSLGMLVGRHFDFESPRQDGQGGKQSINTTVVSGRSVAKDPKSLIVFYRSHLGGLGNLLESILHNRKPSAKDLIVQADLSTTNLIRDPELLGRFNIRLIGCSAHARRPFALYEHEDPVYCAQILHQFTGIAIHEERLDVHGRNRHNVQAVRQAESRRAWQQIREVATKLQSRWSKASKLGAGARYIIKHYDKLTAYLDDPRLEPTNNLRERMLRTEKLIENSSMFRRSLEGRFVLDIIRTVLQTAVAARVPIHEYLVSVLKTDPEEVASHPERFTPRAWAARATPSKIADING
jgi:hypothetical protein